MCLLAYELRVCHWRSVGTLIAKPGSNHGNQGAEYGKQKTYR